MNPRVSVIMPVRNEAAHIASALSAMVAQAPPEGGCEVIVADGMSDDGTREIMAHIQEQYPRIRVIDNVAQFTSAGLNEAICHAGGSIIIRADAHTTYAPDYLVQCVSVLEATGADNVGGPWVAEGVDYISKANAAAFRSPFAVGGARGHMEHYEGPVDTVYLGCWPRGVFEKFGLFDEELARNQDDEHNLRITRAGGTVWQSPRIRSWYTPRSSLNALFRQYYQYGYWKVRVIQKHRLPASVRHLVPGLFVAGVVTCLIGSPFVWLLRVLSLTALLSYAACLLVASFLAAAKSGWRLLPVLPPIFAAYHFGYGTGFLHGVLDFVLLKRHPRRGTTALTR